LSGRQPLQTLMKPRVSVSGSSFSASQSLGRSTEATGLQAAEVSWNAKPPPASAASLG
jgi:hypothetical protein